MENNRIRMYGDIAYNSVEEDGLWLKIRGYGNHYNIANLNREVVDANSFRLFFEAYNNGKIRPALNYEHSNRDILGVVEGVEDRGDGLWFECAINKTIPLVSENLLHNIKAGTINKFSTEGYIVGGRNGIIMDEKTGNYYVKDFMLTAISIVNTPADYNAEFSVASYFKGLQAPETEPEKPISRWYLFS